MRQLSASTMRTRSTWVCAILLGFMCARSPVEAQQAGQVFRFVSDPMDAIRRPMLNLGPSANVPEQPNLPLPDLISYKIGAWQPLQPGMDLFRGGWVPNGQFFRLDLAFEGLVNPPGTIGCCGNLFDPFMFGPRPLFGYVEIDMDADTSTGGDLDFANLLYLGNVARFGGRPPQSRFANRVAADNRAFDGNILTPPFVDRSGEEFHIAFHGWEILNIVRSDESDWRFDVGETWIVFGTLFHRAAGYERFSSACCSGAEGSYNPVVQIQFKYDPDIHRTLVSLVYPLTNDGAAAAGPGPTEVMDNVVDNQTSVHEALNELVISAQGANDTDRDDPEFAIIAGWALKNAADFLDPLGWEVTALLGGSYREAIGGDVFIAWSDVHPNVGAGDFTGDGQVNGADLMHFDQFLNQHDGLTGVDADSAADGAVTLIDFVPNFSLFDLNYDGVVNADDRPTLFDFTNYDADGDGDVDLRDVWAFQRCFSSEPAAALSPACQPLDADGDGAIGPQDILEFVMALTGPG